MDEEIWRESLRKIIKWGAWAECFFGAWMQGGWS